MLLQFQDLCVPYFCAARFLLLCIWIQYYMHTIVYTVLYDWLCIQLCKYKEGGKKCRRSISIQQKPGVLPFFPSPQQQNLAETNEKKGGKKIRSLGTNQDRSHCFLLKTTQQIIKMCSKDSLDEYIHRNSLYRRLLLLLRSIYTMWYHPIEMQHSFLLYRDTSSKTQLLFFFTLLYICWYIYLSRRLRKYICIMALVVVLCSG